MFGWPLYRTSHFVQALTTCCLFTNHGWLSPCPPSGDAAYKTTLRKPLGIVLAEDKDTSTCYTCALWRHTTALIHHAHITMHSLTLLPFFTHPPFAFSERVFVEEILPGGNADKAGRIKVGDVVRKCSATVLKAGKEGAYESEGYGQRPYDNWDVIMFDCEGQVCLSRGLL